MNFALKPLDSLSQPQYTPVCGMLTYWGLECLLCYKYPRKHGTNLNLGMRNSVGEGQTRERHLP